MQTRVSDWGLSMFDARTVRALKEAEGLRLEAYRDTEGFWTIGYGHNLSAEDPNRVWAGTKITEAEAQSMLVEDLGMARRLAMDLPEANCLSGPRFAALTELVFNLGVGKWKGFKKTRAAIQARDWDKAAAELLDSKWAVQVGPRRSKRLADQIQTGTYPE